MCLFYHGWEKFSRKITESKEGARKLCLSKRKTQKWLPKRDLKQVKGLKLLH